MRAKQIVFEQGDLWNIVSGQVTLALEGLPADTELDEVYQEGVLVGFILKSEQFPEYPDEENGDILPVIEYKLVDTRAKAEL